LWDSGTGLQKHHIDTDYVLRIAFSPDGKSLATGQSNRTVRLWNVKAAKELRHFEGGSNSNTVAFSPDGSVLAVGGINDPAVWLWDVATGREIRRLMPEEFDLHENKNSSVTFAPDGKTLAAHGTTKIRLWEVASGKRLWQIDGRPADTPYAVERLMFSLNGKILASGTGNGLVLLWNPTTGKLLHQVPPTANNQRGQRIHDLAFSPDGEILAVADSEKIRLLDIATGQERSRFSVGAFSLAFSPDGKRLASGNGDTTVTMWDLTGR
jgi:WD40 repeat protein